jgi:transcriptional regulator with XRE-family HTH domain
MNLQAFGEQLQTMRERAGLSQDRLANTLDQAARAGALRESNGAPLAAAEQERLNGVLSAAQTALGADAYQRLMAESAASSLDDAIALAKG